MIFRCRRIQAAIYRAEAGDLPRDIAEHAAACPACRKVLDEALTVQRLLRLKRHERPGAEATERCLMAIRGRLVEWEQRKHLDAVGSEQPPLAGWRYGWAAALVAVLAFNLLAVRQTAPLQSGVAEMPSPYQAVPLQLASSNHQFRFEASAGFFGSQQGSARPAAAGRSVMTSAQE